MARELISEGLIMLFALVADILSEEEGVRMAITLERKLLDHFQRLVNKKTRIARPAAEQVRVLI